MLVLNSEIWPTILQMQTLQFDSKIPDSGDSWSLGFFLSCSFSCLFLLLCNFFVRHFLWSDGQVVVEKANRGKWDDWNSFWSKGQIMLRVTVTVGDSLSQITDPVVTGRLRWEMFTQEGQSLLFDDSSKRPDEKKRERLALSQAYHRCEFASRNHNQ